MTTIRGLPVQSAAADITLHPDINGRTGALLPVSIPGGTYLGTGTLILHGPRGSIGPWVSLTPGGLRELARKAERLAAFLEDRLHDRPGPCLCTAWSHNLYPCPRPSKLDYSMCETCHPAGGQSTLDIGHGAEDGRAEACLAAVSCGARAWSDGFCVNHRPDNGR